MRQFINLNHRKLRLNPKHSIREQRFNNNNNKSVCACGDYKWTSQENTVNEPNCEKGDSNENWNCATLHSTHTQTITDTFKLDRTTGFSRSTANKIYTLRANSEQHTLEIECNKCMPTTTKASAAANEMRTSERKWRRLQIYGRLCSLWAEYMHMKTASNAFGTHWQPAQTWLHRSLTKLTEATRQLWKINFTYRIINFIMRFTIL